MRKQLPYNEGSWFAVPLRSSGFAIGVVARMDGCGRAFCYFFGPFAQPPSIADVRGLDSNTAVWSARISDLSLVDGTWPVVGEDHTWDRTCWPMKRFRGVDSTSGESWQAEYDEHTFRLLHRYPCDATDLSDHPEDAMFGAGAVEKRLTYELGGPSAKELTLHNSTPTSRRFVTFYLYFPKAQSLEGVMAALGNEGFQVELLPASDDASKLLLAKRGIDSRGVEHLEELLERVAKDNGGDYDGWEA